MYSTPAPKAGPSPSP